VVVWRALVEGEGAIAVICAGLLEIGCADVDRMKKKISAGVPFVQIALNMKRKRGQ
jgi:hypothetical protein